MPDILPILTHLYETMTERQVKEWMVTPNPYLDDATPAELLAAGGYAEVLELSALIARGTCL